MKKSLLIIIMLWATGTAWAQLGNTSLATSMTLTLDQCIARALDNQPSVRQAVLQQQLADNAVEQSRKSQLPILQANSNQGINFGRNVDPYTNGITNASIITNNLGLALNWTVFNGFQLKNTLAQQSLTAQAARFDAVAARNMVVLNVLLAYLQVLSAQDLVSASDVQVAVAQAQVEHTEKLVKAGTTAPYNLYDVKSQLANDQTQRVQARMNLNTAILSLLQLLNLPSGTPLHLIRFVDTSTETSTVSGLNGYQIYTQARTFMPEVQAAELRTKAAQVSLQLARGMAYPSIVLTAGWGTSYSSAARQSVYGSDPVEQTTAGFVDVAGQSYPVKVLAPLSSADRISYFQQIGNNQYKSLGVSIRIPILNGFQVRYRTTTAGLQQQLAESNAESVRRNLRQAIDQAVNQWQNTNERYQALEQQILVITQAYKAAESRYRAGLLNAVEYNVAKSNLDRVNLNLIQVRYERLLRQKVVQFYQDGTL
ncbi:TolC family protein [Spirosoma panaciterrae]|uniref:TolC family protein n=1 Tax=Spirosoma panaciterrae TaxID=496058 RepID=UPI000382ED54|nr:TolC family protein [Spirosoma panaciterrae]